MENKIVGATEFDIEGQLVNLRLEQSTITH